MGSVLIIDMSLFKREWDAVRFVSSKKKKKKKKRGASIGQSRPEEEGAPGSSPYNTVIETHMDPTIRWR